MRTTSRNLRFVGALGAAVALVTVVAPTAVGTTRSASDFKLAIGKPATVPAQPTAGKPFAVAFKVTRSDTKAPVRAGTMICDPAVTGKVITHSESFVGGTARLSFVIPADAAGKTLTVHLTIKALGKSAHTVAAFRVAAGVKPSLSIADASVTEGNTGTTTIAFPVTLSSTASQPVSVSYSTADGTATAPSDYASATGTLTFNPGETTKSVLVSVVGDTVYEQDETFTVNLTSAGNATLARTSATATIKNDDPAPPPVKPGHYNGTYSDGDYFRFDVDGTGAWISTIAFGFNGHCPGYGTMAGHLTMPGPYAIQSGGTFGVNGKINASNATGTVDVGGKLNPDGSSAGSLNVAVTFSDGTSCSSTGTWTAHVQ